MKKEVDKFFRIKGDKESYLASSRVGWFSGRHDGQ